MRYFCEAALLSIILLSNSYGSRVFILLCPTYYAARLKTIVTFTSLVTKVIFLCGHIISVCKGFKEFRYNIMPYISPSFDWVTIACARVFRLLYCNTLVHRPLDRQHVVNGRFIRVIVSPAKKNLLISTLIIRVPE